VSHAIGGVGDLTLQIGEVNLVMVKQSDVPDTAGS